MKITAALRSYMTEKHGMAVDASDDVVAVTVGEALAADKLTLDKLTELSVQPKSAEERLADMVGNAVNRAVATAMEKANPVDFTSTVDDTFNVQDNLPDNQPDPNDVLKAAADASAKGGHLRVKKSSERYSGTKTVLKYDSADKWGRVGNDVRFLENGREKTVDDLSQQEWAKMTAWLLHSFSKAGLKDVYANMQPGMKEHLDGLVKEVAHEDTFVGPWDDADIRGGHYKLSDFQRKTVLDESAASGGGNAVPEWFDTAIIRTPLLHGELFPYVDVIPVARGGAADSASIGTPTFVSTASGTTVSEFSTTGFVAAFDTSFFPMTCAITFGLDFLSDAVPNFAQLVADQIGQEHLRWLDEQIAIGDGTTEPQGIFVGSNTAVSGITNTFSTMTYNDILEILFTINKAHRLAFGGQNTRLVMNDAQYKELLQISVNSEANHPTFGVNAAKEYMLAGYPVSVEGNISNSNIALCNLKGYRLYRRQGLQFQVETGGKTLMLDNEQLLLARARYGGALTLAGYCAEFTG